jgi:hypothetical protein
MTNFPTLLTVFSSGYRRNRREERKKGAGGKRDLSRKRESI